MSSENHNVSTIVQYNDHLVKLDQNRNRNIIL